MKKQLIIVGIIVLLVCVGLSGCNEQKPIINTENDSAKFIGSWDSTVFSPFSTWNFYSDGSFFPGYWTGLYRSWYLDNGKLVINISQSRSYYNYEFSNDNRTLTLNGSIVLTKKINSNDFNFIMGRLGAILNESWQIMEYENNTVPHGYNGSKECLYVKIGNPEIIVNKTGKYISTDTFAFYYIWFTPLAWNGTYAGEHISYYQDWMPNVNETSFYKIYWATDGDPTNIIYKIVAGIWF